MYSVSNSFLNAIKSPAQTFKLRGLIDFISFTDADVLQGSCTISNQCARKDEVTIGSVYIGELNITLLTTFHRILDFPIGKKITLECGLLISEDTYEWVPMGEFYIAEATKTRNGLVIKAYDVMSKLDQPVSEQVNGTAYEIANYVCTHLGLILANANFDNFANHTQRLVLYPDSDIETYRDMLYWLAQAMGCFVTANREGKIEFRTYGMTAADTLDTEHRFVGGKFADYETWYTSITVDNMDDDSTSTYANQTNDGLIYDLGANPFLQFNDKDTARQNVLAAISSFKYVPFSIDSVSNPAYDLGDILSFPGGLGDTNKKFCITQFTWKYNNSISISGGGQNPQLLSVKSALEKQLNGIKKRQSDKDVIQYYSFTNTIDLLIEDGQYVTIVDINYAALKKSQAIFNAEILFNVETTASETILPYTYNDAVAEFYYYFDEVLVDRIPAETWQDGNHMAHLLYYLITDPGIIHHLEIKCKIIGGSALIPMAGVKACLYGQNLVASDDWNGIIKANDDAEAVDIPTLGFATPVEDLDPSILIPEEISASDEPANISIPGFIFADASDSVDFE